MLFPLQLYTLVIMCGHLWVSHGTLSPIPIPTTKECQSGIRIITIIIVPLYNGVSHMTGNNARNNGCGKSLLINIINFRLQTVLCGQIFITVKICRTFYMKLYVQKLILRVFNFRQE